MRKTLATVLLGTTLLATSCASRDRAAAVAENEQVMAGALGKQADTRPSEDLAGNAGPTAAPVAPDPKADPARPDPTGGESYRDYGTNPWTDASKDRLSTFAADVDTASYTLMRRKLTEGALPPKASVRVEEFVNYFSYSFPDPTAASPFSVVIDAAPSPVSAARHILRVGVATKAKHESERKPANLVFLVDVSGSMRGPDRIDLAKKSLRILTQNLKEGDSVAL